MSTMTKERPVLFSPTMVQAILAGRKTTTRRVVKAPKWWKGMTHYCTGNVDEHGRSRMNMSLCTKDADKWADCPHGVPGDRLWVRETFVTGYPADSGSIRCTDENGDEIDKQVWYRATEPDFTWLNTDGEMTDRVPWKPSIFMPRWASRITLEITGVRVERLQAITDEDAIAEGLEVRMGDGTGPGPGFKWDGPAYWDGFSTCPTWGKTYHAPTREGLCCCDVGQRERLSPAVCAFRHLWDKLNADRGFDWASNPWVWVIGFKRLDGPGAPLFARLETDPLAGGLEPHPVRRDARRANGEDTR